MTEQAPPRSGLTRRDTGHPAFPYSSGWYYTKAEVRAIERRAKYRRPDDEAPPLPEPENPFVKTGQLRERRTCAGCGETYQPRSVRQRFCSVACRRADETQRRYGKAGAA